jgi:putative membrane protein insertion efficiency factor
VLKRAALAAIRLYQRSVSASLGVACRYEPTCSVYTYEAVERHGPIRGTWMGIRRIARCRPGRAGGYDPVVAESESGLMATSESSFVDGAIQHSPAASHAHIHPQATSTERQA